MTKKTPETLLAVLDTLASGNVVYSDAAVACGVRPNTFWHWMRASQLNRDPDLIVPYLSEAMPFYRAVEAARQIALHDTRARTEKRSQKYLGEPVFFRDIPEFDTVRDAEPRISPDIDLDDLLGPDPVADRVPDKPDIIPDKMPRGIARSEPDRVTDNIAAPVAVDASPAREPRNDLERDLFARLAAARAKNAPPGQGGAGQTQGPSRAA